MIPLLIGIGLGLIAIATMALAGVLRERGTWAATMVAIASFYVVFAFQTGEAETIVVHTGLAVGFVILTLLGTRVMPWLLAATLIGHGIFDVTVGLVTTNPSPSWWGPFCLGIDVTLGLAPAVLLARGGFSPAPSATRRSTR